MTVSMEDFLAERITEQELYARTPVDAPYEAVYLCSALVLAEYRLRGITRRLVLAALAHMRKDHPVSTLFVWPFSREGRLAAGAIAKAAALPLREPGRG